MVGHDLLKDLPQHFKIVLYQRFHVREPFFISKLDEYSIAFDSCINKQHAARYKPQKSSHLPLLTSIYICAERAIPSPTHSQYPSF